MKKRSKASAKNVDATEMTLLINQLIFTVLWAQKTWKATTNTGNRECEKWMKLDVKFVFVFFLL